MLLAGQTAFDRPDIVTRVFHQRLEAFLSNLRAGKYFGAHKVVYIIRVIEYQHRGNSKFLNYIWLFTLFTCFVIYVIRTATCPHCL